MLAPNSYGTVPTVRVKSEKAPGGNVLINESEFDPEKHELFTDVVPPPVPPPPVVPKAPPAALANLPKNWRNEKTQWLRETAEKACGRMPETREQAVHMIEAGLST